MAFGSNRSLGGIQGPGAGVYPNKPSNLGVEISTREGLPSSGNTKWMLPLANTLLSVQFKDTSVDVGSQIVSWLWDFGDNTTSTLQNPLHLFVGAGQYLVTLTVEDALGNQSVSTAIVTVG